MSVGTSGFSTFGSAESSFPDEAGALHETMADDPASMPTPVPSHSLTPEPSVQVRLVAVRRARNPLLEAAQPLLRALADMPELLEPEEVDVFHRLLVREVEQFQAICNSAQIRHEHTVGASYALCTAIDERAHSTRWGAAAMHGAGVWAGRQLAVVFHDDARGGDKVFLLIGRLVTAPDEHIDLIEVLHLILGLGFEGRYGAAANGRRQIETIRHRLYTLLAAARAEVPLALSPQLRGTAPARRGRMRFPPPWVTAVTAILALLLIFATYKYRLVRLESDAIRRISDLGTINRETSAAMPPKALRLKELLAPEIARGTVEVEEDADRSAVVLKGDEMFVAGQARLNARMVPVLAKVAAEIRQVSGVVEVAGHSDNRPIRTSVYPDNQALSERRAAAVAEVLEANGVERRRIKVEGRADSAPVADNTTAVGRARNRRVDIVVKPSDASGPASRASVATRPVRIQH